MVAEVVIETNVKTLDKTFDYEIPAELNIKIGSRVFVPFGKQKQLAEGIVIAIKEKSDFKIKPIAALQDEQIDEEYIELARWMASRYFCNLAECLRIMLPPGRTSKTLDNRTRAKRINCITLAKNKDEILNDIENKQIKGEKQVAVLKYLIDNDNSSMADIELFTDASSATVNSLIKKGYVEKNLKAVERNPFIHVVERTEKLKLNIEQQHAVDTVKAQLHMNSKFLIHGVTGSGKTEIYLQLIEKVLEEGKGSIMLVPEISLTPQTVDRFIGRFGEEQIAVLHSKLSAGERFDQWMKVKEGKAKILIGARSAIFAPMKNLGIIIIDEEHDESYESESSPRYNSIEVAKYLGEMKNVPLVLGSATPSLQTYYEAENDDIKKVVLAKRANNSALPAVEVVDLRDELSKGNKSMMSDKLQMEIKHNLEKKQQTILFLNRRGFSSFILCRDCGSTIKCPHCDVTLTYHKNTNRLKCHYCGYEKVMVKECPACHSKNIKPFGAGTQKLEDEINTLFPQATTLRMDADTVTKKNSHEMILEKFRKENVDILIGTQMVVKGHDFPNVTLVGVIAADAELNFGDFKAAERTFQILTQVAGRAGRGSEKGRVIIQTYNPESYAIEFAKKQDYEAFYDTEIGIRKALKYPPFCDIILTDISARDQRELNAVAAKLHAYLKKRVIDEKFGLLLYSPVPAPIEKIKDRYRKRILIKCKYDARVNELMNGMLQEFIKMKAKTVRVAVQLNPNNML